MSIQRIRPVAQSSFRREGLGWRYSPATAPVVFVFSRLVERREEVTVELHVQDSEGRHVLRRRVNLLGSRTPGDLARDLDQATGGSGVAWKPIVEQAFASVLEDHRAGDGVKLLGGKTNAPPAPRHLIDGLLLEHTANTWFGPGGTGKSTAAAASCIAVQRVLPLAGRETHHAIPLYLDWEDEEEAFERLLWEVSTGYGLRQSERVHWRHMQAPLRDEVPYLSGLIAQLGVTYVVIDSATRAMGSPSDHGSYESSTVAFAESIRALGRVTVLIIDHVDGQTVKDGTVAAKAYGSIHKMNFVRNAWSLTPDDEAAIQTVGWTHVKANHSAKERRPFGVVYRRTLHGGLELSPVAGADVAPLAARMSPLQRMVAYLDAEGPQTPEAIALALLGESVPKAVAEINRVFNLNLGKHMTRLPDGRYQSRTWAQTPIGDPRAADDPGEDAEEPDAPSLPF